MIETFFAICVLTALQCNDIGVQYYDGLERLAGENAYAAAAMDQDGNYYILVNPKVENYSERFFQRLMVHEISHIIALDLDVNNTSHYGIYEEICADLQERARVSGRYTCKPYEHPPPYPWRPSRRE